MTAIAEDLAALLVAELGDTYSCTRVWAAWGYGTMTQDDFEPAEERAAEIADSIIRRFPHITTPQAAVAALETDRDRWKQCSVTQVEALGELLEKLKEAETFRLEVLQCADAVEASLAALQQSSQEQGVKDGNVISSLQASLAIMTESRDGYAKQAAAYGHECDRLRASLADSKREKEGVQGVLGRLMDAALTAGLPRTSPAFVAALYALDILDAPHNSEAHNG